MNKSIPFWRTLAWSGLMLLVFLLPADNLSRAPSVAGISELVHILMFAGLTWFFIRDLLKASGTDKPALKNYALALMLSVFFGIAIEILQKVSGLGRSAEFIDVVYDTAGSILSAVILVLFFRFRRKSRFRE